MYPINPRKINAEYIAGFVDGEGCFSLSFRKDKDKYFYWKASFLILLRKDDEEIIRLIKDYFNCGNCTISKDSVRYQISDVETLHDVIVPFFNTYTLIGKKRHDFQLWKEAITIIYKNKKKATNSSKGFKGFQPNIWNRGDLVRLNKIRTHMQLYKSGASGRVLKYYGS